MNSKKKGNTFENKTAKELGQWFFKDKDFFERHQTSGAKKTVYTGDIVPLKQFNMTSENWLKFPFHIECKTGYGDLIPNFTQYNILKTWIDTALLESSNDRYFIFIIKFLNKRTLFITNYELNNISWEICLNHKLKFYVYDYKLILEQNYLDLFNREIFY